MPGTDLRLEELNMYTGACPAPKDFAKHWKQVKEQIPAAAKHYAKELMEEVNADREAHGKKPLLTFQKKESKIS